MQNEFKGEIVVASKIIDYLSSGLYESPAACLKELVNNSFDADAGLVKIFVKPDANRIIIDDDGHGMNADEFQKNFKKISESHKREDSDHTPLGRPKVGKIGIGFIAANEICDEMELHSTKKGSDELIKVVIDFAKMRAPESDRRRADDKFAKADYVGKIEKTDRSTQYTRIYLKQVRGEARAILAGALRPGATKRLGSLYGLKASSVRDTLAASPKSWTDFDFYSETMLQIALNVPVQYYDNWIPPTFIPKLGYFIDRARKLGFNVQYDGAELRKPVVFSGLTNSNSLVKEFSVKGKTVSARGYFVAQHGTMRPQDLNGVLLRIRNAAVGGYDSTFMGFPASQGALFQKWISAEIWADDKLEEAMNIDRKTLRVSHPAYCELQKMFHVEFAKFLAEVHKNIYEVGAEKRRDDNVIKEINKIKEVATKRESIAGKLASSKIKQLWTKVYNAEAERKKLVAKYSVSELYEIVSDVAYDVLGKAEANAFLQKLTERLIEDKQ